ncbi:hypothetical protein M422DRAFT_23757 [Sphaerobolus stellatus SS14]|nr:hypothetical protein M422DRAFT_23757 [Sphaerobolus stellatus SS14]
MSDFSDLWTPSNPAKTQKTTLSTLGATAKSNSANTSRVATPDAFSLLSATRSPQQSRPITPALSKTTPSSKPASINNDAFGGLVSLGGSSSSRDDNLTIAERAARAEQEHKRLLEKDTAAFKSQGSFWDKFESSTPSSQPAPAPAKAQAPAWDDFDVLSAPPAQSKPVASSNNGDLLSDFDFLGSGSQATPAMPPKAKPDISASNNNDLLSDFDLLGSPSYAPPSTQSRNRSPFDEPTSSLSSLSPAAGPSRTDTPGSFDFGNREDGLDDEDDILGDLAKPIEAVRKPTRETVTRERQQTTRVPEPNRRSSSPPPHILGRIVEMGFSIEQAKVALAATSTGLDVDAALEILLQNGEDAPQDLPPPQQVRSDFERPTPRAKPIWEREEENAESSSSQPALQEQADKLFNQASSIGLSMFSKANALWKEGHKKVLKVYEEQVASSSTAPKNTSRPKWMDTSFEDQPVYQSASRRPKAAVDTSFEDQPVYQSASRRPKPAAQQSIPPQERAASRMSSSPKPISATSSPRRTPAPPAAPLWAPEPDIPRPPSIPPIRRPNIEASPASISTSNAHKEVGTGHFKLGRFAEAEAAYSLALDALPASHLLRVPLYNNRALTRLKTGEYKGTIEDASEVLRLVTVDLGPAWHPERESPGGEINLGDAVAKALRRRGEAFEGLEKWKDASADWERLNSSSWAAHSLKMDAVKGLGRCRKMSAPKPAAPAKPATSAPRPKPKPVVSSTSENSVALSKLQAANDAQAKEEQERYELKDAVDSRLQAWRGGKETNLRALIASLDTILSPSFKWQKVGLHEVVTPAQVKIRYTKAIARLHPDKLNANNTTLEERMIANGVFSTLNEAWNAFKP